MVYTKNNTVIIKGKEYKCGDKMSKVVFINDDDRKVTSKNAQICAVGEKSFEIVDRYRNYTVDVESVMEGKCEA